MIIYIILLISTIILYIFCLTLRPNNLRKLYACVMGISLFVVVALRDFSVGGDVGNYLRYYRSFNTMSIIGAIRSMRWESGYILLNKIVAFTTNGSERAFLIVVALIITIGIAKFIYTFSRMQWLSWYLYIGMGLLIYPLSGFRAAIAMVIGLNGLKYLLHNETADCGSSERSALFNARYNRLNCFKYYSYVLLACLFHQTSIVYAFLYPLCKLRHTYKYYLSMCIIAFGGYLFGGTALAYLANRFYQSYLETITDSGGGYGLFLFLLAVLAIGKLMVPTKDKESDEYKVYNHILMLAIVLQIITFKFSLFSRVVEFLSVTLIVYIPFIIGKMKKKARFIAVFLVCSASLYLFYSFLYGADYAGVIPYKFMWQ